MTYQTNSSFLAAFNVNTDFENLWDVLTLTLPSSMQDLGEKVMQRLTRIKL